MFTRSLLTPFSLSFFRSPKLNEESQSLARFTFYKNLCIFNVITGPSFLLLHPESVRVVMLYFKVFHSKTVLLQFPLNKHFPQQSETLFATKIFETLLYRTLVFLQADYESLHSFLSSFGSVITVWKERDSIFQSTYYVRASQNNATKKRPPY